MGNAFTLPNEWRYGHIPSPGQQKACQIEASTSLTWLVLTQCPHAMIASAPTHVLSYPAWEPCQTHMFLPITIDSRKFTRSAVQEVNAAMIKRLSPCLLPSSNQAPGGASHTFCILLEVVTGYVQQITYFDCDTAAFMPDLNSLRSLL